MQSATIGSAAAAAIDLVLVGAGPRPQWQWGAVHQIEATPLALARFDRDIGRESNSIASLYWDASLPVPTEETIERLLGDGADAWHIGLKLGLRGLPAIRAAIHPISQMSLDADSQIASASWRITFRGCLVKAWVLRALGGVSPQFRSLEAAGLDTGFRWAKGGAIVRHAPELCPSAAAATPFLPLADEVLFARRHFGRGWAAWGLYRRWWDGAVSIGQIARTLPILMRGNREVSSPATPPPRERITVLENARVSVVIPTVDRPTYLRSTLRQLRSQTIRPQQVLVVDQTALESRDLSYKEEFADLPLEVIVLDVAGQSTARNAAIALATGDWVLLADDDIEMSPTLISDHLATCENFGADVSCGNLIEDRDRMTIDSVGHPRMSDVCPGSNSLVRRSALLAVGGFDAAYDRGIRADGDLGCRLQRAGNLLVFNPTVAVFHHKAPRGGLRNHKARVITYASSRRMLLHRHLMVPTEVYLGLRHFGDKAMRDEMAIRTWATLRLRGTIFRQVLRVLIGVALIPSTVFRHRRTMQMGRELYRNYPSLLSVPDLESTSSTLSLKSGANTATAVQGSSA